MTKMNFFNIKLLAGSLVLLLLVTSCRKEPLDIQSPLTRTCTTYSEQFEAVWEGIDHTYVLWSRDTVDWDARYEKYRPIFASFDANGVDSATYVSTWQKCTEGLLDHHMAIILWNPVGKFTTVITPAKNDYGHVTNYDAQVAALKAQSGISQYVDYKDNNRKFVNSVFCLLPGKTEGKYIAYFRFSKFDVASMNRAPNEALLPFAAFYGDSLGRGIHNGAADREDVESIIVDLRNNIGGNVNEISPFIVSLLQDYANFGYSRYKQGLGRLDYTGWLPVQINCPKYHLTTPKPIVALTDINTVSCAEMSAQIIKNLPNGTVIGERTYGATCSLAPNMITIDMYYSGCFGDSNMYNNLKPALANQNEFRYYVYSATFDIVTTEYQTLEGVGVKPDIEVLYDATSLASGRDNQLERALQYLRTGN